MGDRPRESRIQIFDQDGKFIREIKYAGLPCALDIGKQYIYMVNGFTGQLLRLDLDGKVLAAVGKARERSGRIRRSPLYRGEPQGRYLRRGFRESGRAEVR